MDTTVVFSIGRDTLAEVTLLDTDPAAAARFARETLHEGAPAAVIVEAAREAGHEASLTNVEDGAYSPTHAEVLD
jgi:hypothetical protein